MIRWSPGGHPRRARCSFSVRTRALEHHQYPCGAYQRVRGIGFGVVGLPCASGVRLRQEHTVGAKGWWLPHGYRTAPPAHLPTRKAISYARRFEPPSIDRARIVNHAPACLWPTALRSTTLLTLHPLGGGAFSILVLGWSLLAQVRG